MALNLAQKFPVKANQPFNIRKASTSTFEIILLLVVISLFYFFMIQPKLSELASARADYQQAQKDQQLLKDNKKKLQDALKAYTRHKDDVAKLDEALPLDPRTPKVYMLIESMVERSGMTMGELSVSSSGDAVMAGNTQLINDPFQAARALKKVDMVLGATGNFDQFMALLEYLETSGRLIDITSLDVTANGDDKLNFSTKLTTYYYE